MNQSNNCPLAAALAQRLRRDREELVRRWLERIVDRVALGPNDVFPTDELLDHVPLLIDGIASYLEDPVDEITADIPVVAKAMELGELRHAQGFGPHQILKEYEILGGVLFDFLVQTADEVDEPCTRGELLVCGHRVFRSVSVIQQFTTDHFLRLAQEQVKAREERLRGFNRAVSHELKNRIGAAGGAVEMLQEDWIAEDAAQRGKFTGIVARNIAAMRETLASLIELSRSEADGARERNILLPDAAAEVKRQLREFAEARGVRVELADDIPRVEVPAATLELALSNYVSNAVKYRDPSKTDPWVRVESEIRDGDESCDLVVRVRDNGLGIPEEARQQLFERFFRAHEGTVTGEEGSGLGLSIVRETVEAVGGRAWAEFPEEGSIFALSIPCRDSGKSTPSAAPHAEAVHQGVD